MNIELLKDSMRVKENHMILTHKEMERLVELEDLFKGLESEKKELDNLLKKLKGGMVERQISEYYLWEVKESVRNQFNTKAFKNAYSNLYDEFSYTNTIHTLKRKGGNK